MTLESKLEGAWGPLRYAFGLMNGNPLGESGSYSLENVNAHFDAVGRLGVDGWIANDLLRLEAGLSGLSGRGFHPGSPATKDDLVWRDANEDGIVQLTEIQAIPGGPATPSENFSRFAVGADLRATVAIPRLGPFQLHSEVYYANNLDRGLLPADPVAAGRDLRHLGFYAGFIQEITPYAFVGFRYDWYHADFDANEVRGTEVVPVDPIFSTLAVSAGYLYRPYARFILQYEHNNNPFGRDEDGSPTTLGVRIG